MNRFIQAIHWRFGVSFVCSMLLLVVGVVTCSQPSDVTVQQPLAVAAQPRFFCRSLGNASSTGDWSARRSATFCPVDDVA